MIKSFLWISLFTILYINLSTIKATGEENGYFQQHVDYTIEARLNVLLNQIDATETLIYTNNSTDTLTSIYFHLYFNKFKKDALTPEGTLRKETTAFIDIQQLNENSYANFNYEIDRTLMRLDLNKTLFPGDSVVLDFKFTASLPYASGRYGYMGNHYDVGNWFPTPVVYDQQGWHLHQHIDNEFYQEWGNFSVNITVPKGFILGATGTLINPEEALQDTTREVRDWYLHNMNDTTKFTTWKYRAEKVHDFAWTADPEYKYYTESWDGIKIHYLVMRQNYDAWKKEIEAGVGTVRFLSELVGRYPYDQITIADTYITSGGMEYPNIVFINTNAHPEYDRGYFRAVIVHEIAHNWFYGLLGSNQTEYEWQDEGFTSFSEIKTMENLYGVYNNYAPSAYDWYSKHFSYELDDRHSTYLGALGLVKSGKETDPINTMPDKFGYGVGESQYDKMAVVLFMLEQTLGEEYFWKGMREYFAKWKFRHPQPGDFITVMEDAYGSDLDWFFNHWIYSLGKLDYKLSSLKNTKFENAYNAEIEIERLEKIHMPLDILLVLENGDSLYYRIPVDNFSKHIKGKKYLKYWHFSQPKYTVSIPVLSKVDEVIIDPENTLLDINRLNNSSRFLPKMEFHWMKRQLSAPPLDAYMWELWPTIFYNDIDKFKIGIAGYGGYLKNHIIDLKLWYKTYTHDVDFSVNYENPIPWLNYAQGYIDLFRLDGRHGGNLKVRFTPVDDVVYFLSMNSYELDDERYVNYPWQKGKYSTIGLNQNYFFSGDWANSFTYLEVDLKNSIAGSKSDFSIASIAVKQSISSRYLDYELSLKIKAGAAHKNTPVQELFNLAGANGVEEFEHAWYRSRGSLPVSWRRDGHLYLDKKATVRGVSLFPDDYPQIGMHVLAASADLSIPNIFYEIHFPFLEDFDHSLFFDTGAVWNSKMPDYKNFVKSLGFSMVYNNFGILRKIFGLEEIKLDFPIWIGQNKRKNEGFDFRWLISFDFYLQRTPFF